MEYTQSKIGLLQTGTFENNSVNVSFMGILYQTKKSAKLTEQTSAVAMHLLVAPVRHLLHTSNIDILVYYINDSSAMQIVFTLLTY